MTHTLEYAWCTDRGRVRTGNEDAVAVDSALGFLIVADGIGGARAGEVASALAAEFIAKRFREHMAYQMPSDAAQAFVETAIQDANLAIWTLSKAEPDLSGMGTTVVAGTVGDAFGWRSATSVIRACIGCARDDWSSSRATIPFFKRSSIKGSSARARTHAAMESEPTF
ncbi:PP2C family protein-serine/threonine phosphatase [Thiocapsa sp.]|uniref:PP2C family protein-serine/threonine phosphatase n=1 Tax=Thiocapsa sp. TaxID=2024551 RepID=UPI002CE44E69|nr:protein phosphatase 2C domain-containing protein [Thiocapsa sp.]HSO81154.1 protein phosphatase 2C domain-containing protein [Thiocapsa sp.]